jgi:pimeloyl-ACP methyl ester carboxylesterase
MSVGDTKVHYEVHGSGEPLILITGLCGDLTSWKKALPLLEKEYKVITIDNRGAGKTEHPGRPFSMEDLADDASGLLTGLGIGRSHVLGASMGGNVAQELTLRHPDQVATLTLMSTYMRRPERSSVGIDAMINTVKEGASIETFLTMMQAWCLTNAAFRGRENVSQNDKRGARERDLYLVDGFARQKWALDRFDSHERISAITVPTLVVHGNEDIMVPPRFGEELASRIEGSRLVLLDGCGHMIAPDRYTPILLDFLRRNRMQN